MAITGRTALVAALGALLAGAAERAALSNDDWETRVVGFLERFFAN